MVVTVAIMRIMEMAVHEVVHMVAVRHGFMAAAGPVAMIARVTAAIVGRRASVRIHRGNVKPVLDDGSVFLLMVKVAVVQIVGVAAMGDRRVSTIGAMPMRMVGMNVIARHARLL